jgi:hypothetical protein
MLHRMFIVGIPLLALLMLLAYGCFWVLNRLLKKRFQYSLRTLLVFVTAVAVILSAITTWDQWNKAQLEFVDSSSPAFAALNKPVEITEEKKDLRFKTTFRPRYREIGEVLGFNEESDPFNGSWGCRTDFMNQTSILEASDRRDLEKKLADMQKADVLLPGRFVIHGLLKDSAGNLIQGAQINLVSYNVFDVSFKTLEDGTFFIPIKPPVQSSYHLLIYYRDKKMESSEFSLNPAQPERYVVVQVR